MRSRPRHSVRLVRTGLSMVETVIAMFIVSVTVVSALALVPAIKRGEGELQDRALASALASQMIAEVRLVPFESDTTKAEADALGREGFDDVDHFDGWSASPPEEPDGTEIDWAAGFTRRVAVVMVSRDRLDPVGSGSADTGVRVVTVTIERSGGELATHRCVRTLAGWEAR